MNDKKKAYLHEYYERVTKVKRQQKRAEAQAKVEIQGVRPVQHTCPTCKCVWEEETDIRRPHKVKMCPKCRAEYDRKYRKKRRTVINARSRERWQNDEEFRKRKTQATMNWYYNNKSTVDTDN